MRKNQHEKDAMEESFEFEIDLGLRPDYSKLEKKLIAENAQLKAELKQIAEAKTTEQHTNADNCRSFSNKLHREISLLIEESNFSNARKELLFRKIAPLNEGVFDNSVFEIFHFLSIRE